MPAGMTVPTVFTAVDKFSSVVGKMGKSLGGFVKGAAFGISRLNEKFIQLVRSIAKMNRYLLEHRRNYINAQ